MKNWIWRITGALEEIRKLRQKVEYQERWINARISQPKSDDKGSPANALRVMQRRAERLMTAHPELFKEFFGKNAPK